MAFDFPSSPAVGQKYPVTPTAGIPTYVWDGEKWRIDNSGAATIFVSDAPPAVAQDGALWFESDSGLLWLRYNDGTTTQWVIACPQPDFTTIASLASPALTGNPTAPTPPAGDADTSIATTAFVANTAVRYDIPQTLTTPQQLQARQTVYAAPFNALAYNGLQVNGAFEITQESGSDFGRNTVGYFCDQWLLDYVMPGLSWSHFQQSISIVPGFLCHSMGGVSSGPQPVLGAATYVLMYQPIEGYLIQTLGWGTANAQPITISFWSRHIATGIYTVNIVNHNGTRSYCASYTQAASMVAQYNSVTIPGDTVGVYNTGISIGFYLQFVLACGTTYTAPSANTWLAGNYFAAPGQVNAAATSDGFVSFTGITVHPGSQGPTAAQSLIAVRPFPQEFLKCCRYFYRSWSSFEYLWSGWVTNGNIQHQLCERFPVPMRVAPTMSSYGGNQSGNLGGGSTFELITCTTFTDRRTGIGDGPGFFHNGYVASARY